MKSRLFFGEICSSWFSPAAQIHFQEKKGPINPQYITCPSPKIILCMINYIFWIAAEHIYINTGIVLWCQQEM